MSNNAARHALASTSGPVPRAVPSRPIPKLRTRKPTGRPSWPLILVEGGEKTGKSWAAAEFTASERIGQAYWLDWMEGAADEYAAIPGANYEVIEHDGTWNDILGQVEAVAHEAARAAAAGEPPVLLVIDSMTAEWDHLKSWAHYQVSRTKRGRDILAKDPGAELQVPMNVWNDCNEKHYKLMRVLMRFPGIVVMTARGKEVTALDQDGRPIQGRKEYRVEGHKNLAFDASAWVRLSRDTAPQIVGARSVHAGLRPGKDKPRQVPDFSLEWLVFDVLLKGTGGRAGQARVLPEPDHSRDEPVDWRAELEVAGDDVDRLRDLYKRAKQSQADADILAMIDRAGRAANGEDPDAPVNGDGTAPEENK